MRRTKEGAEQTRQTILDAAEGVFLTNGVPRTSLEMIARECRFTRGAVYWQPVDLPPSLGTAALFTDTRDDRLTPLELGLRDLIRANLGQIRGNLRQTATQLGISRARLYVKLYRYALDPADFRVGR